MKKSDLFGFVIECFMIVMMIFVVCFAAYGVSNIVGKADKRPVDGCCCGCCNNTEKDEKAVREAPTASERGFTVAKTAIIEKDIVAPVREPVVEPPMEPVVEYFDVPLAHDLQDYIFEISESYGVDPAIVVSMIRKESTFNPSLIGDSGESFGLMQIQPKWHQSRMDILGVSDLMDPYQNIRVGVDYLAELLGRGKGVEWALMAYNGGPSYANRKAAAGELSSYAINVLGYSEEI